MACMATQAHLLGRSEIQFSEIQLENPDLAIIHTTGRATKLTFYAC